MSFCLTCKASNPMTPCANSDHVSPPDSFTLALLDEYTLSKRPSANTDNNLCSVIQVIFIQSRVIHLQNRILGLTYITCYLHVALRPRSKSAL